MNRVKKKFSKYNLHAKVLEQFEDEVGSCFAFIPVVTIHKENSFQKQKRYKAIPFATIELIYTAKK